MMKKLIVTIIFIMGLCIFSYPIISDFFATKEYHTTISAYNEVVKKMDEDKISIENQKVAAHNRALEESEIKVADPFFENNSDENSGTESYYDVLNINSTIGSITIPKINVQIPIYHGTSQKVLSRGAGHLENSSLPSGDHGVHSVITAHRGLPSSKLFRNLDELVVGDQFSIQVLDENLTYEIDEIKTVLPTETNWLQINEDKNVVTLLTCEPYMINTHRLLVTGHLIPNTEKSEVPAVPNNDVFLRTAMGLILIIIFTIIIWKVWQQKKS